MLTCLAPAAAAAPAEAKEPADLRSVIDVRACNNNFFSISLLSNFVFH